MQHEHARLQDDTVEGDAANSNDAVNARLVDVLKANAVRAARPNEVGQRLPKRGFFAEVGGLFSVVGLMVVAYVYGLLVGKDA